MAKKNDFIVRPMAQVKASTAVSQHEPQKVKTPAEKALKTATWARTMTKVIISRNNKKPPFWHVINFLGAGKQESGGIIDLLAIRKDHGKTSSLPKGDGFEIILVQVKGGFWLLREMMTLVIVRAQVAVFRAFSAGVLTF